MLARSVLQTRSKIVACPACQARKVPMLTQTTHTNASARIIEASAVSNVPGVTPEPAWNAPCCAGLMIRAQPGAVSQALYRQARPMEYPSPQAAEPGPKHRTSWYGCLRNSSLGIVLESAGFDDGKYIQQVCGFSGAYGPGGLPSARTSWLSFIAGRSYAGLTESA